MTATGERHLWIWYTPCGMGGVETYLLNMARETIRDGGAVWIAATHDVNGPLRELLIDVGVQLLDWSDFHPAFMAKQPAESFQQRLISDLALVRPTLIALNDCNDFSIGAAPLLRRLQPYCTIIDTFHIDSPVGQYLDFRSSFLDVVDGFAGTNQVAIESFRHRYPNATSVEARYIANGVTLPDRVRGPPGETLRLLYVGRLVQDQKRILDLPPLLERLHASGCSFFMTVVGDGPQREALETEIARRGLGDNVRLTGYLSPQQVMDQYFEHDVFVNLSSFEGFSMSVLEAFATGCVPVCTDIASLDRAVFLDGVNCRLCPVDHLDQMVDIWNALSPTLLQHLSAGAQATGRKLTGNKTYNEYHRLLADLRVRRPLQSWPTDAASVLGLDWDMTQHNPWLARPHPLRKLAGAVLGRARRVLGRGKK